MKYPPHTPHSPAGVWHILGPVARNKDSGGHPGLLPLQISLPTPGKKTHLGQGKQHKGLQWARGSPKMLERWGGGFLVLLFNMDVELGGNETETGTLSLKN